VSAPALPRYLSIYAVVLPLALFLGYLLATPYQFSTLTIVGLVVAVLLIPMFLRSHHPLLIFAWNANITLIFLPGKPALWMVFAGISLAITLLNCVLDKRLQFQHVPSITWPLLCLLAIVLLTAKLTGGIGLRALGSTTYGGKKFIFIFAAVIGYFALSSHRLEMRRVQKVTSIYFLSGLTGIIANLVYLAGPALYFLFLIFPTDNAIGNAMEDFAVGGGPRFSRIAGAAAAGTAALHFLIMRYSVRGLLDLSRPWRMIGAVALVGFTLLGGFRSAVLMLGLLFLIQFYCEGLFRTRLVIPVLVSVLLAGALVVPFARHLPMSMQRSLSFLPLDIDAAARANARDSLDWRFEMWGILLGEVPKYFWIGKGYAINPTDLYFAEQSIRRGLAKDYEGAVVSGDYHSGPLSIMIPFGIFGVLAFLWFIIASIRLLYRNYRFSDERIRNINTFLFSYFVARTIFYFVGYGAFNSDLPAFAGIVALSIAINGGMRRWPEPVAEEARAELLPAPAPA
jgi:O-antigen ligase